MCLHQFRSGDIIFREGDESDKAYIIRSGKIEIFRRIKQGTLLLATLDEGEIFGEMGVLSDQPRTAYAAAATDCELYAIGRDEFAAHMAQQPLEVMLMVRALMERLREANRHIANLTERHAQFQIAGKEAPAVTRIVITPMTGYLKERMPSGGVMTASLPYRVGGLPAGVEPNSLDWNNLFVRDADSTVISRNHFAIQRGAEGLSITDRGSTTGTIVNDVAIGAGAEQFQAPLRFGDNIVIAGDSESPYRFCVTWE